MSGGADEPERTPDGRYLVVDGRRWRASDPGIPPVLRAQLVAELMRARRQVKTHGDAARPMVHDAKIALGERGTPWWEVPSEEAVVERMTSTVRALLRHRDGTTICPSEAARAIGGERWRDLMDVARRVAADLTEQGETAVHQRGQPVDPGEARGPIRIAPGPRLQR